MRKILSLLVTVLFCTSMFASQEGTLTVSPEGVINPATDVTLNYDGTGTNFDKWEPKCFIYAWLVPADGQEFSKAYEDEWIACQGDEQYAAIAEKRKMAFVEKGKYSIQINIKEYFGVADEDLDKIARMGVVVCTQWVGGTQEGDNKTKDFYLDVNKSQEPIIEPNFFVTGDSALVVDAGYDKAIAWNSDAIASYGDTIKLTLKAGQEYQLKVVAKGAWKGYNDLTEKAEGLQEIGLGNIGFKLAEAGEVQVIYTAELFKLIGNFYVPEPVYSLKNNWGGGADWTWVEMKKILPDYYVLDTVFGGKGVNFSALESHADEKYIEAKDIPAFDREEKKVSLDALDTVRFGYIPSVDSLFALIMGKYVEPTEPTYYLKNNWGGEAEWTWKPLEKESEGVYSLKKVVFGGSGVNLNIAKIDDGSKFFSVNEKEPNHIQGDKIQALDTVNFTVEIQTEQVIVTAELVARPTYRLENGFYLFGSPFDWKLENVTDAQKFVANTETETEGEFVLKGVTLAEGDSLKVIAVENDIIKEWYGAGEGGAKNYGINAKQAGEDKEIYFNYNWQEAWKGHIWVGENIEPIVVKDLKLVPGVWTADEAKLAVWAWGEELEGAWSVFSGEGDTLVAKINEKADSVIFARMDPEKDIEWPAVWNKTDNLLLDECGLFFVNTWDQYSWCEAAEPIIAPDFHVTGDSALVVDAAGLDAEKAWHSDAIASYGDTLKLNLKANQEYQLKVYANEAWKGFSDLTEKAEGLSTNGDNNIIFTLAEEGEVQVIYAAELFKLIGNFVVPEPLDLEDGYYLNGTIAEWKLENLEPFKFIANPEKLGEFYVENVVLVEGDEIKACFVKDNAIDDNAWYGVGDGNNNLVVTAEQAGTRTIYFNTEKQVDWNGYIYVDVSGGTGVENTDAAVKAVKTLKDGQLIIEKNGKRYNVLGAIVR